MENVIIAKDGFVKQVNTKWHEVALWVFMAVVILHWVEHIAQAAQIWILDMPRPESLGGLGLLFPFLVTSELMHFTFAVLMFGGLMLLRPGFHGKSRKWWTASTAIQGWHLIEHTALLAQVIVGANLFGSPVPSSFLQPLIPRPELHLLYNLAVFAPMVVGMWLHTRESEHALNGCGCAEERKVAPQIEVPTMAG